MRKATLILAFTAADSAQIPALVLPGPPATPEQALVDALDRVQQDHLGHGSVDLESYLGLIAHAHATQAIPAIERLYLSHTDLDEQLVIASVLVRLGDTRPRFWNLLEIQARQALESNPPSLFDESATAAQPFSAAFAAFAASRHLSLPEASEQADTLGLRFAYFAQTGDSRALPLLRRALHSGNFVFQTSAAAGLGKLNDRDAIPFIVASCANPQRLPGPCLLADSLLYFNDPRAEPAYNKHFAVEDYAQARRYRFEGGHDDWCPEPTAPLPRPLPTPEKP